MKSEDLYFLHTKFTRREKIDLYLKKNILGMINFEEKQSSLPNHSKKIPYLSIGIESQKSGYFMEVWFSSHIVKYQQIEEFSFSYDPENLFGCISFPEFIEGKKLEEITESIYVKLFKYIQKLGYPYLYRMWNYIPRINKEEIGLERYRAFCIGRNRAFKKQFTDAEEVLPAATGIAKNTTGSVEVYFLAHKNPCMTHLENPRQTPAYRYPELYGPKPPSFARATYVQRNDMEFELYVSGTASILESKSMYSGNIIKQCEVTLVNIRTLISLENLKNYGIDHFFTLKDLGNIKIYYRRDEDFSIIKKYCDLTFSQEAEKVYIHVDICRKDLLVEIEGSIQSKKFKFLKGLS